jgi:hypothetical protein
MGQTPEEKKNIRKSQTSEIGQTPEFKEFVQIRKN